jgi:hypothetical protein
VRSVWHVAGEPPVHLFGGLGTALNVLAINMVVLLAEPAGLERTRS